MSDRLYTFGETYRTPSSLAQRIAVLWPLRGRRSIKQAVVEEDINWLVDRWRKRVTRLYRAGWPESGSSSKLQYLRNCPPAMVDVVEGLSRTCRLAQVCPWCYARRMHTIYENITALLPVRCEADRETAYFKTLEVRNTYTCVHKERVDLAPFIAFRRRAPQKLLKKLQPTGAYYSLLIDPKEVGKKPPRYRLIYRILAIVPADWVVPDWLSASNAKYRTTDIMRRRDLIGSLSRTCRYPIGLFRSSIETTLRALNAYSCGRMISFTGKLLQRGG